MKNRLQSFMESMGSYPAGADNSRAPWNEKAPEYKVKEFDDVLYATDGETELPVHIKYRYSLVDHESGRKLIDPDFECKFKNPDDEAKVDKKMLDDDCKELITHNIGDKNWEWA